MVDAGVRKVRSFSITYQDAKAAYGTIIQYYGSAFKIPLLGQWVVVVSGPNMVDELKKRPEDELSVIEGLLEVRVTSMISAPTLACLTSCGARQVVQLEHMLSRASRVDPAHMHVVHETLGARTLAAHVPEMVDELQLAVQDYMPTAGTGTLLLNREGPELSADSPLKMDGPVCTRYP